MARKLVYSVEFEQAKALAQAKQMAGTFKRELQDVAIKIDTKAATAAAKQAAAGIQQAEKQITQMTVAEAHKRLGITQQEEQARSAAIRQMAAQAVAAEEAITADLQAEARKRAQIAQQQPANPTTSPKPAGGGLGSKLLGGVAAYLTVQTAKQVAQAALAIDDLRTKVLRAEKGFQILSGSTAKAEANLRSIQGAAGGAIDRLTAMQIANQAIALGLANTSKEFGELTTAARAVSLISPVIHDVQSAITELGMASANVSWRRLDQLGLSITEVKNRMKELQQEDPALDDSAAFLAASVETLNSKYGDLLKTQEANASGAERLRVQWEELKRAIAVGPVGNWVDEALRKISDAMRDLQLMAGSTAPGVVSPGLDKMIADINVNKMKPPSGMFEFGTSQEDRIAEGDKLIKQLETIRADYKALQEAVAAGVPGAIAAEEAMGKIIAQIINANGLGPEMIAQAAAITSNFNQAAAAYAMYGQTYIDATEEINKASDERIVKQQQMIDAATEAAKDNPELGAFAMGLAEQGVDEDFFTSELLRMKDFLAQRDAIISGIDNQASKLIEALGMGEAAQFLAQERAMVEAEFARFNELELTGPDLTLAVANLENQVSAQVDAIIEQKNRLQEALNFDVNADAMAQALDQLNSSAFDGMDGIAGLRDQLYSLVQAVAISGSMTAEQAGQFAYLSAVANSASASTGMYAQLQGILGSEFLTTNSYAAALVEQMIMLDAAQASGQIGAAQHAGAMSVLTGEMYNALNAAGVLAPQLAQVFALKQALLSGPGAGTADFTRGVAGGNAAIFAERFKADQARRKQLFDEQIKAQKEAAKETAKGFKDAAKGAAKDFNSAAKSARSAFENVAKSLESALRNVEGLFGTSKVTQEDLDIAKAGGAVNKADDWLRQLRDEVEHGKDWAGVSIEQAKEALSRIGVETGDSAKEILARFEQAWSDSSLFASKENLALINQDAVRQQLAIQDKIKEGQKNILELFGATVDGVMAGFESGDPVVTGMVASELAGSEDKKAQEWAKALREGKEDVKKEILAAAVAELQDVSAIGAGGGGGSSAGGDLGLGGALDPAIWAPMDYAGFFAPVVEATDALNKSGFFEGFDAFKDGAENLASWSAGLTVPAMANSTLEGPLTREQMMGGMGAAGAMGGPGLTLDPTTATDYVQALASQFEALKGSEVLLKTGATLGYAIGGALSGVTLASSALGYITALDTAFVQNDAITPTKAIGKDIGARIGLGMSQAALDTPALGYVEALGVAFLGEESLNKAVAVGSGIGAVVASGMDEAAFDIHTVAYITALAASINADTNRGLSESAGKVLGENVAGGLGGADFTAPVTTYLDKLDLAFKTQEALESSMAIGKGIQGMILTGVADVSGDSLALATSQLMAGLSASMQAGPTEVEGADGKVRMLPDPASGAGAAKALDDAFLAYQHADLAGDFRDDLSAQFTVITPNLEALGYNAATFIDFGFQDYDFGPSVDGMIGNLSAAFKKDDSIAQLKGLGSFVGEAIFSGFRDSLSGQRWLDALRDELVSAASTQIATGLADQMNATVTTGTGGGRP